MPIGVSNRPLYGRGGTGFLTQRYSPLPPLHEVPQKGSYVSTEVRLTGRGKAQVQPSSVPPSVVALTHARGQQRTRSPINRPCMRFKAAVSPPSPRRYRKLTESDGRDEGGRRGGVGGGLLRAVANRGRGYEDLRCRGAGGNLPDSGGSSPVNSPRVSPNVSPRAPQSGILITSSAIAKSGIKRLSRVSFGSSKGSMVETLIYDSPVAEEEKILEEDTLISDPVAQKLGSETGEPHKPASRVRVTFFESEKPLAVTSPEPPDLHTFSAPLFDFAMTSQGPDAVPAFGRQLSSESGRDNPFRPDGDISKEADEIVQLIKSGRPLDVSQQQHITSDESDAATTHPPHSSPFSPATREEGVQEPLIDGPPKDNGVSQKHRQLQSPAPPPTGAGGSPPSPAKPSSGGANGSAAAAAAAADTSPGTVEVKHATVTPSEPAQVEHVVLKKKNKCSCCVIQ